jgi:DNA-directed RNA polymerase subunit RPC12/RpoP
LERRSISIEPDLHRRILRFRAFFMSHGIDVDYTAAINFLAEFGFDELLKSGFSPAQLERLGSRAALADATREAISSDWLEGKMPGFSVGEKRLEGGDSEEIAAGTVQPLPPAQAQLKAVRAHCVRCKASIQIKDPHVVTMKNGRPAIQGVCPDCGSKVFRVGIPH